MGSTRAAIAAGLVIALFVCFGPLRAQSEPDAQVAKITLKSLAAQVATLRSPTGPATVQAKTSSPRRTRRMRSRWASS